MYMYILMPGPVEMLIVASVSLLAAVVWWIDKLRKKGASRGQNP